MARFFERSNFWTFQRLDNDLRAGQRFTGACPPNQLRFTGAFVGVGLWPDIARVSRATSLTRPLHGCVAMPTRTNRKQTRCNDVPLRTSSQPVLFPSDLLSKCNIERGCNL